jgi:adenylate kinase
MPAVALTGTPGTGKSAVASLLSPRFQLAEVADLALSLRCGRRRGHAVEVDLARLRRRLRADARAGPTDLMVGHLAHLLPVREAIVLRCHPCELLARLRRARRGTPRTRLANFVSEATDGILLEALSAGLPVFEIDTTGRTPQAVANEVARRLRHPGAPRFGLVDWLSDPEVTAHLLDRPR